MKKYCKVINNETKEVSVGLGTNKDFYKSIGYEEKEIIEVNNRYYLKGYEPKEDINKTIENKKQELLNTLKKNIETHIYNYYPRYRQDNIAIYGTEEERNSFKVFKEYNTTIYHTIENLIKETNDMEELNKMDVSIDIFDKSSGHCEELPLPCHCEERSDVAISLQSLCHCEEQSDEAIPHPENCHSHASGNLERLESSIDETIMTSQDPRLREDDSFEDGRLLRRSAPRNDVMTSQDLHEDDKVFDEQPQEDINND